MLPPETAHRSAGAFIPPLGLHRSWPLRDPRRIARACRLSACAIASTVALWSAPAVAQTLDANLWVPNGPVFAVVRSANTIYIGGRFTSVGPANGGTGVARRNIAALDATTGAATSWNPGASGGLPNEVDALAVTGKTVYVAGAFALIGGQARQNVAALDAVSGLATDWDPEVSGDFVDALAVAGNTIYVGGRFSGIGSESRTNLGAIDASTGVPIPWAPSFGSDVVFTLAVSGKTVYAGGQGPGGLVAIDAVSGVTTDWNPDPISFGFTTDVKALAVRGNTIYAGGNFHSIGGAMRTALAQIDPTTAAAEDWNPNISGHLPHTGVPFVDALAASRNLVYAGGSFTSAGGQARSGLAALDARTANALPWDPDADNEVTALCLSGNTLYVGGWFDNICGQLHPHLAAISVASGSSVIGPADPAQASLSIARPTHDRTQLTFAVPVDGPVEVAAFDVSGRRVAMIAHEVLPSGSYTREWDMSGLAKGYYYVRMRSRGTEVARTVLKLD